MKSNQTALVVLFGLVSGACTSSYTTFSETGGVTPSEYEDVTVTRMFGANNYKRLSVNNVGAVVYSLPVTQLEIEGGPCVVPQKATGSTKPAASSKTIESGTQINITNTPSATATATTAKPTSPTGKSSSCDKNSDTAPYGIKIKATTVGQTDQSFQVGFTLADWTDEDHSVKINNKGLLTTLDQTSASQAEAAILEIASFAGGFGQGVLSYRLAKDGEEELVTTKARNLKNYKPGPFKTICTIDGPEFCSEIKIPLVGKTISRTQTLLDTKLATEGDKDLSLKSTEPCKLNPVETTAAANDPTKCVKLTETKGIKSGEKYYLQTIETRTVKALANQLFVSLHVDLAGLSGCEASVNAAHADKGLLFRAPKTSKLRFRAFPNVTNSPVSSPVALSDLLNGLPDAQKGAIANWSGVTLLREGSSDGGALRFSNQDIPKISESLIDSLSLSDGSVEALEESASISLLDLFRRIVSETSVERTPYFDIQLPITYVDPCTTYVATPIRRAFVQTKTTLGFQDGILTQFDADYPGVGGVVLGIPGDIINAFFSGAKDLLTFRIEQINAETQLIEADTARIGAQELNDQARENPSLAIDDDSGVSGTE